MPTMQQGPRTGSSNKSRTGSGLATKIRAYSRRFALAAEGLPPPGAKYWGPQSKAAVVAAVCDGTLSLDEARARYALSTEEYLSWQHGVDRFGLEGLTTAARQQRRLDQLRYKSSHPYQIR